MPEAMSQRHRSGAPDRSELPNYLVSDPRRRPDPATRELARGLGWFSIGLGVTELACGGAIARWLGMPRSAPVIRAYGVRELLQGVGILGASDPTPWISARVAGDALDIATVLPGLEGHNPRKDNVVVALIALAGVTAVDVICARSLSDAPSLRLRRSDAITAAAAASAIVPRRCGARHAASNHRPTSSDQKRCVLGP